MKPAPDPAKQRRDAIVFRTATPIGAVLFVIGQIGGRTDIITLARDPHHLITQGVGALVLL